jgi:hypothetical protein
VEEALAVGGLRSTIVLLVVLAGLGGYIYFVESERDPAAADAKARAFPDLSADAIEEIQIKSADGETSRVLRDGDDWRLVEPRALDADTGVVGTVTSNLSTLEVQRVVDENPSDLAQYGLNPPRLDVSFRLKDQKEFQRLLVGDKTATGGDLFAKRPNETRVFLISSFLDSIFNKAAFDLRDKSVLAFEREKVESIEVSEGAQTLQFARNGMDWRIARPIAARADYAAIEGLMTRLSSTFMQRVVEPEAKDLRQYGLDRPVLTASVNAGSARSVLLIGGTADEGGRFAKDAAKPEVFTVEETLFTELAKDAPEYRRKDVFDARSFTATRIELQRGADMMAFDKTRVDGKETWRNAAGATVDLMKVEDLVSRLSSVRAVAFEPTAHPSLKTPVLTVTLRFDGKSETVTFGRADMDVFAARSDEPGAARIDAMALDESLKAIDALK